MYSVLATVIQNKCKCGLLFIHTHTHTSVVSFSTQVSPEAESVWLTCGIVWKLMIFSDSRDYDSSTHFVTPLVCFSQLHTFSYWKDFYSLLFINLVICHITDPTINILLTGQTSSDFYLPYHKNIYILI